ncbi:MAG: MFS transporter [Actinobacteria bacterium]|nr:MAG: MFS transporter [Actinomycetota bacterium]
MLDRNFRLLFAGRAISYVGTYLAPIAVAFAILDLGGSATAVGLSFAAWTLAQVATLGIGGVIGDRLPRRAVMIASDVSSTAVRTTMGVLLVTGHAEVWELIALQACGGAAVAFYNPTFYGLVREIVPADRLQQANSYLAIARYGAFPLGAALGGTIVATVGSGTALLFDGGTYAASALLLAFVRVESLARAGAGVLRELREGWSAFVEHQWVWVLCLWIALYFLITYAPFFVLGPYIAKHSMGGAGAWGAVVTGEGVGALLGSFGGLRLRARRPLVTLSWIFLPTALQSVLLAFHASVYALAPAAAFAGFGFACGSVVWDTAVQETIAPDKLARVAAYGWMSAMVFLPAGYALAGPISSVVGMRAYLLFGAAWLLVTTAFVARLPSVREYRSEKPLATPAPEPA